jgi:hypothetical protein
LHLGTKGQIALAGPPSKGGVTLNSHIPVHVSSARTALALVVLIVLVMGGAADFNPGPATQQAHAQAAEAGALPKFAAVFARASYGGPETSYNTVAVEDADLNMLLATNVQCIRIDVGYAPWLQNNQTAINEMTNLVQSIKAAGRCLIIADAASESYRGSGKLSWSQFLAAWVPRVSTLAALYHPDYYEVIKEPGWYVPMISDATTNPQFQNVSVWLSLTQNLTNAVHAVSPSTVVGVAIAANSLTQANGAFFAQYLNKAQAIQGVSFIGFDIYGSSDQTATQNYLSANPPSKAIWIPEAWSTADGAPLDGNPLQDVAWFTSLYTFAISIHAAFLIPFYTDHFASYSLTSSSPKSSAQIISLYLQRTPIFSTIQNLVASIINSSTTTSSSSTSVTSSTTSTSGISTTSTSGSSSHTSHSSTVSSSGNGLFSPAAIILEVIVLIVLVAAVFYIRRREALS